MKELNIRPIGVVRNKMNTETLKYSKEDIELDFTLIKERGNALSPSEIIIYDEYLECLDGIEDFSHLVIIYWTHKIPEKARELKKVHPMGMKKMPIKGIFATRSPVRPNPIGLIVVKLLERKNNILFVEDLDAINNTPIIDIKPHLPLYDSPSNVKLANWMYSLTNEYKDRINNPE
jgi:tRNA-Thr(GGU) m(6)t(6)A37 methyltransferase TsaA